MGTETLEKLLQGAVSNFQAGNKKKTAGKRDDARRLFLQASDKLMQAAGKSRGRLRESRIQLAEQLLQQAKALEDQATSATPSGKRNRPASVDDDEQSRKWMVQERPSTTFADVAGLELVKEEIRLKLLYPFSHPELAEKYGVQPGGGILLFGPPGTGKTMMARAVAGEIEAAFFAIKPSEIMSQWVGMAEQNIAKLFEEARSYSVSVIFIDELEALAPKRRSSASTVMRRVVPQLLAELDGFEKRTSAMLFIGATNEPWAIDSAVLRPGRLDRLIYVPPPDLTARKRILELNLTDAPLSSAVTLDEIASSTNGFSGADMSALTRRAREHVFLESIRMQTARAIEQHDFDLILKDMQPSISDSDLDLFERFASGQNVKGGRKK